MTSIVILAAGSSSRMGRPKQNLIFKNQTLLQHTVTEARSVSDRVLVVIGANKDEILPNLSHFKIEILENYHWFDGMATSITLAVNHVLSSGTETEGIVFLTCDQPYLNAELLNKLIQTAALSTKGIIACAYNNTIGVPAYYKKQYFTELQQLKGQDGAKTLIRKFANDVETVSFESGGIDIDTLQDYEMLLSGE